MVTAVMDISQLHLDLTLSDHHAIDVFAHRGSDQNNEKFWLRQFGLVSLIYYLRQSLKNEVLAYMLEKKKSLLAV